MITIIALIVLAATLLAALAMYIIYNDGTPALTDFTALCTAEKKDYEQVEAGYRAAFFLLTIVPLLFSAGSVIWVGAYLYEAGTITASLPLAIWLAAPVLLAAAAILLNVAGTQRAESDNMAADAHNNALFASIRAEIAAGNNENACLLVQHTDASEGEMLACRAAIDAHAEDEDRFEALSQLVMDGIYKPADGGHNIPAIPAAHQTWFIENFQTLSWKLYAPTADYELNYVGENLADFCTSSWSADARRTFWTITDRELSARMATYAQDPDLNTAALKLRQQLDDSRAACGLAG